MSNFLKSGILKNSSDLTVPFYIYKKDPGLKKWFFAPYLHFFLFLDPVRPIKSQNFSYPESRLVCTQKKRIWTTITTQQTKKESEFMQPRKPKKNCLYWALLCGCLYLGSFWKFSQACELRFFFRLLRWDRGSNALLLSTNKPTFRITKILTFNGPDWI